ncbi:MAG: alpha/beta hydrolase, partial [Candidatus Omnitrophica bacterium]|nr:alpha/beta hydrolase [Candidatus Omnitrophota bacterium]
DKYVTDEKIVYKSASSMPFMPLITESRARITLDRSYNLMSYFKEGSGSGIQEILYLENKDDNISFVATSRSEFARLTDLPIKHGTFVFEEDSPVTYLPILENYNFRFGRAQAFNVITNPSPLLPPMKRILTLTSIRDEYIKIGSRKLKVECLLIKIKNSPQGMLWVTKSGRSLVGIEFPDKKLKLIRTNLAKPVTAKRFTLKNDAYVEESIKFNGKKITLSGTLSRPKREGLYPAIILIGGPEECEREGQGLFTYIADTLAREGYLVLRYDKRGIGDSAGDSKAVTDADELEDANAALDYILNRKETDPKMVGLIGQGKGAYFAAKLASDRKNVRALILMSPMISLGGETDLSFDNLNEMASKLKWEDQYLKLAIKSRMETIDKVKTNKHSWASFLRIRCFLKRLRDALEEKAIDIISKVESPVLILHGKEDEYIPAKASDILDKVLEESGNKNHKLIYYGYLGHFFGRPINDGIHRIYYETDKDVLDTIKKWLAKIDLTL